MQELISSVCLRRELTVQEYGDIYVDYLRVMKKVMKEFSFHQIPLSLEMLLPLTQGWKKPKGFLN